jgi:TRAP-type C4-dicarboxylate transport system permease small subunit
MRRILLWLQQAVEGVDRWGLWVAMVSVVGIMLLATADAIGRYAFNSPILFAFDSVKWLMVFLFSGALMFSLRTGVHVRMGALYGNISPKWKRRLDYVGYLVIIVLFSVIGRVLAILAWDHTVRNPHHFSIPLPLQTAVIEYALAAGSFLLALRALYMLVRRMSQEESKVQQF